MIQKYIHERSSRIRCQALEILIKDANASKNTVYVNHWLNSYFDNVMKEYQEEYKKLTGGYYIIQQKEDKQ